jgi:hypothetical protein
VFKLIDRPKSVTWAASATILESLPLLSLSLVAALRLFGILPTPSTPDGGDNALFLVLTLIPGGWCLATGLGLLKLRKWARYSIIAFSAVTIYIMLDGFGVVMMWDIRRHKPVFIGIWDFTYRVGVPLFYIGISMWLLVLFNLRGIVSEFRKERYQDDSGYWPKKPSL